MRVTNNVPLRHYPLCSVKTEQKMKEHKLVTDVQIKVKSSGEFYGAGYEDVSNRVPSINNIGNDLNWTPQYTFEQSLHNILSSLK